MTEQERELFIELLKAHPERWEQVKAILADQEPTSVSQETQTQAET